MFFVSYGDLCRLAGSKPKRLCVLLKAVYSHICLRLSNPSRSKLPPSCGDTYNLTWLTLAASKTTLYRLLMDDFSVCYH